ncbi:hypothetical protein GOP47_0000038 [Adiantum capillus-veneris]|uniref:Uncharacterized protein n=1 Tax=Adiantum capillus-veneris TaxID=13818 RepID=A0A9D4VD50_ADICA|nr:hypothetical protein GOP47_0000038 [Adiantum capillus-veneris]
MQKSAIFGNNIVSDEHNMYAHCNEPNVDITSKKLDEDFIVDKVLETNKDGLQDQVQDDTCHEGPESAIEPYNEESRYACKGLGILKHAIEFDCLEMPIICCKDRGGDDVLLQINVRSGRLQLMLNEEGCNLNYKFEKFLITPFEPGGAQCKSKLHERFDGLWSNAAQAYNRMADVDKMKQIFMYSWKGLNLSYILLLAAL